MKIEKTKVTYIEQVDLFQHIEVCGRICYKSENLITQESKKVFVENMIKLGHGSVLEHGTVYFKTKPNISDSINKKHIILLLSNDNAEHYAITNQRVVVEEKLDQNENITFVDKKEFMDNVAYNKCQRFTFKIVTSRNIANQIVRHRAFSFSQESQRYCNYSKDKFGKQIAFIIPSSIDDEKQIETIIKTCKFNEKKYFELIENGAKPEQANAVLPNCTKTELMMTGLYDDFLHFIKLRTSIKAQPEIRLIASKIQDIIKEQCLKK